MKDFLLLEVIVKTSENGCVLGIQHVKLQQVRDQIPGAVPAAWFDQ